MKVLKPDYFDKFVCIPQKCSDNCCTCWQVEIDDESTADYIYHINSKDHLFDLLRGAVKNRNVKLLNLTKKKDV